jgi:glycine cleavage system regulatory protein
MFLVNASASEPGTEYLANRCSRYCHNHGCPHIEQKIEMHKGQYPILLKLKSIYDGNIALLHNNGMGLSYQQANLLIYVLLSPALMLILLWLAIRKRKI